MVDIISDNIISPLGFSTEQNYTAAKAGVSAVKPFDGYCAAYIDNKMLDGTFGDVFQQNPNSFTKVEKSAMLSVKSALDSCDVDFSDPKTAFFFSTTKGNVELLDNGDAVNPGVYLWNTAQKISNYFGNNNTPIVVSNACISGLSAMITAARALKSHRIDTAVVTGVDMLSKFVVSGFSCLKALSQNPCRPFDIERTGLNLGEAAATVVLCCSDGSTKYPKLLDGYISNDAYHISSPSKTAEGSYQVLHKVVSDCTVADLAFINAHGTSTLYNDEMEAVAIDRAGLNNVPVNSLKAIFGHTLGAAGVLESVISLHALMDNTVLKTVNYATPGVSKKINVVGGVNQSTNKSYFIKLISGFGGCNAAALFRKGE